MTGTVEQPLPTTGTVTAGTVAGTARRRWHRHPSDVARLVFNLVILAVLVFLAEVPTDGVKGLSIDIIALFDQLPRAVVSGLVGVGQLLATAAPVVIIVVVVWRRRLDLLLLLVLAAVFSATLMVLLVDLVGESVPIESLGFERADSWLIGASYPSSTYLAGTTAVLVAAGPWMGRRWRAAGWVFIALITVTRILTATDVPMRIGMMLAVGAAAGSATLVIFGAPRRRVDTVTVAASLQKAGLAVEHLDRVVEEHGVPTFSAAEIDGGRYFVKVLGRDERDTDLLLGAWKTLTLRGLGDDSFRGSPHAAVEHEALALAVVGAASARTALPIAVLRTGDGAAVLVTSWVEGTRLDLVDPAAISDVALRDLWLQVAALQRRRIAHHALQGANLIVAGDTISMVDLRLAHLDASDEELGADVAQLLATLALRVGTDRAVAGAEGVLRPDELARAVPLLQPAVLTPPTRAALKKDKALLPELRDRAAVAAGVDKVQLAAVQRITIKGAVSLVGSVVLAWYVLNLASNWDQIWDAFSTADLAYVPPIIVLMIATYFTGALSLLGAVTVELAFLRTTAVMFGQSFLNRFTPANAGGMAMRTRYLQLNGLDTTVAAASVGLTSAASGIVQGVFIVVFFMWGGASDRFSDFTFPSIGTVLLVILGIGAVVTVVLVSTWGRRVVRPWFKATLRKITSSFGELARDPGKLAQLFGGAALGKLATITAFWFSVLAFDVDMSFAKAGALFMIANTLGSAVPTPGGVGGVEAALTGVLISFGVDNGTAAAIVLLFRTLTFWLPTLPGYGFLRYTERAGIV